MDAEHAALQAERARAAALVARDGYLRTLQTGPRFLEVTLTPEQILDLGEGAVLSGRLFIRLQRDGELIEARSWVSALWLGGAEGWRLRMFQSTRAAP